MATLELTHISKRFGAVEVIKDVELAVRDGEFVVFVGPSGCGKSTLLRIIAGLENASGGEIRIDGDLCNDKSPRARGIAMVFQTYALYPHKTVYQNLAFGLKLARRPKAEIDARIREAAKVLQMEHLLDRRPDQLSGGQRQRVAIGRAIVRDPNIFLFDEPLSNLDAALRVSMRREIARLHGDLKSTMIYVTHDQVEAMTLADRIVVLNAGEVQQVGTPMDLYMSPRNLFVAGFIGSPKMNTVGGVVTRSADGRVEVKCASLGSFSLQLLESARVSTGDNVTLGIRPEHLEVDLQRAIEGLAIVQLVEQLGDETIIELAAIDGETIVVKSHAEQKVHVGDRASIVVRDQHIYLFDSRGLAIAKS